MVFNTVGFNYENVLAEFAGMGHTYLEILGNFTRRLFNWFVELFDHKVVPNIPGDRPSYWFISGNGEEYESFLDYQKSSNYNRNLYPHSKFNPYDSIFKRMRIYYWGETVLEKLDRKSLKHDILNSFGPIKMGPAPAAGTVLAVSTSTTPQLSPIGLNLILGPAFNNGFVETANKIASLPSTPGMKPITHLITKGITDPYAPNPLVEAVSGLIGSSLAVIGGQQSTPEWDDEIPTLSVTMENTMLPVESFITNIFVISISVIIANFNKYNVLALKKRYRNIFN